MALAALHWHQPCVKFLTFSSGTYICNIDRVNTIYFTWINLFSRFVIFCQGEAPQLPPRPTLGHPLYHYVVNGPHALALFDYTAAQSDELSFSVQYLSK